MNWLTGPCSISRPRPMTTRSSAISAISDSRWLLTRTVRPSRARATRTSRIQRTPSGSSPLAGSSRITVCGSPSSTPARPSRWRMPERVAARPCAGRPRSSRRARAPRRPRDWAMPLLAASQRRWLRPDLAGWTYPASSRAPISNIGRSSSWYCLPSNARRPALEAVEPEHASHRGALARAVGAEEPGHPARVDVEAEVVDGDGVAEPLGDVADLDHRCRCATARS